MPPIAEPSACQDPKAPIGVAQARPRIPSLQHNQLLPQTEVFGDEQRLWSENRRNG